MTDYLNLPIGDKYPEAVTAVIEIPKGGVNNDEKGLAHATGNARFSDIESYTGVHPHVLLEIAHFFSIYKDLEGKTTEALRWKDREVAYRVIEAAHQGYREKHAAA
ncbi:MAG TPA: inorganic diphosphatase [Acidobacteriaceae bacterium]|nr:inorganic diphosphatase [Acidobacteriaceae bacterium]